MSKPMILGLTGGIASGKSTVSAFFSQWGDRVLDGDKLAREALEPGTACYTDTVAAFGPKILNPDGTVNRKALGKLVFASVADRRTLNGIVHPYVLSRLQELSWGAGGLVVWDVPLLFETGWDAFVDKTLVVTAGEALRIRRIRERDGVSHEQARLRIKAQLPEEEKIRRADYVIHNDGTLEELEKQARKVYDTLHEAMD